MSWISVIEPLSPDTRPWVQSPALKKKKQLWDLGSLTRSAGSESQVTFKLVLFKVPSHVEFDLPRTDFM